MLSRTENQMPTLLPDEGQKRAKQTANDTTITLRPFDAEPVRVDMKNPLRLQIGVLDDPAQDRPSEHGDLLRGDANDALTPR